LTTAGPRNNLGGGQAGGMTMKWMSAALVLGAIATAAPAEAAMVRAQDPASVAAAMRAGGFPAEIGTDSVGDPMITSSVDGTNFRVYFYNCTNNRECATVQFHSSYDFNEAPSFVTMNDFNKDQRFASAYLDKDSDPVVEMDVDLDDGGMSEALFIDNLQFWQSVLDKFETTIGYE
jgi:hypothetical protein